VISIVLFATYFCPEGIWHLPWKKYPYKVKRKIMSLKTYAVCPVSDKKVDEHVARVNGFLKQPMAYVLHVKYTHSSIDCSIR